MIRPLLGFTGVILLIFPTILAAAEESKAEVAEDLEVTLITPPGLVAHPMMATVDDQGRLFVAESSGDNLKPDEIEKAPPHSIRMLTDTDGDGVYDRAVTFADGMNFPQGALWVYDSLYVMSPPSLWRLADTDGDDIADVREELVTGFEYTGNAADVHGPFLHPNGRLHWCHGRKGHEVYDPDTGELVSKNKGARIWTSDINGGDVRVFAGGGMDNPVEVDFTETGDVVGSVNLFYGRPRGDTLVHWLHGGAYPRYDQAAVVAEFPRTGDLLHEFHNFGHVAVSGMCRYRSGWLNRDWKDAWLVSHFNTAEVSLTKTRKAGASYEEAGTETIFKLKTPGAHITDVLEDRNGDILVVNTGGWFRIGCPTSQIARPELAGGIYRISRKEGKVKVPTIPWSTLSAEAIAEKLGAPQYWIRERAMTELAMRGHPAIPELRNILEGGGSSIEAQRNAIWTLARMKFSDSPDLIYGALTHQNASIQQAACNAIAATRSWQTVARNEPAEMAIEMERNATIAGALTRLVRGGRPAVAREAADALGVMGESRAVGSLLSALGRVGDDRALDHALVYALIEIDDFEATKVGLEMESPTQISGVLWALDQMNSSKLEVLDVSPLLESPEHLVRETAAEIISRHPEWDAAIANRFLSWQDDWTEERKEVVKLITPAFLGSPPMQRFVTQLIDSTETEIRNMGLELIANSSGLTFHQEWEGSFREILTSANPEPAIDALLACRTDALDQEIAAIAENDANPTILRVKALQAGAKPNAALSKNSFDLLLQTILDEPLYRVRAQAIDILTTARLTKDMRLELASITGKLGPLELPPVFAMYYRIESEELAKALADGITTSSGFRNLDAARVKQRFMGFPESIRKPVEETIAGIEKEQAARAQKIESLKARLEEGDPLRGKAVYAGGKGTCIVCHMIGDAGRDVGPNLSTIGRIRTGEDLLESILYPSESIARDFETYAIEFKDGSPPFMGLIREESRDSLVLADLAGQTRTVARDKVARITSSATSLMPMGLDQTISDTELIDLVSFLRSLK